MAVLGATELKKEFRSIRNGLRNVARNAAAAGARHLRTAARAAAPRATGKGARMILMRREQSSQPGVGIATVGPARSAFYLNILETGARAHPIMPRRNRGTHVLRFRVRGGMTLFRAVVRHPGIRARHWFQAVFTREHGAIEERMREVYEKQLLTQAQKRGL